MIKQSQKSQSKNIYSKNQCLTVQPSKIQLSTNSISFSEHDFIHWCSSMTLEEIQSKFRIYCPECVLYFRQNINKFYKNWVLDIQKINIYENGYKSNISSTLQKFIQILLFTSERQYLDSITFSSDCFLFPQKVYKLLTQVKSICYLLTKKQVQSSKQLTNITQKHQKLDTRIQLLTKIIYKLQQNLLIKMKLKFSNSYQNKNKFFSQPQFQLSLQQYSLNSQYSTFSINYYKDLYQDQYQQISIIQEFNHLWKYYTEQQKYNIWYLGHNNIHKAIYKQLTYKKQLNLQQIQQYLYNYPIKISKLGKQLSEKLFTWKLYQNNYGITYYIQLVFKQLKNRLNKYKYNNPKKDKDKYKYKKQSKNKKYKQNSRYIRRNSIDQSSNQTNQTDIIYEKQFNIDIQNIIQNKLQKDIQQLTNQINQQANKYYQNRILGYQRLRHILACIDIYPKIYGSCCAGLAIKNSDIDITIQENVLQKYFSYIQGTQLRILALFQYLKTYFTNFQWISNIKVIPSATIPIIKFTINNNIKFYSQFYDTETHNILNKQLQFKSQIQIDLTIETTQPNRKHLGIISTKQTRMWLQQISTLQSIAIILKYQLASKSLNETYYGGINTFGLLILLIAVIRKQKLQKQTNVAKVFEKIVKFYGMEFEEQKIGINLNSQEIFYSKQRMTQNQCLGGQYHINNNSSSNRQLQIKDPLGNNRNITRNCYHFKSIKQIFKNIYQNCFLVTKNKVQEICSIWDPKENMYSEEKLEQWVDKEINQNKFIRLLKFDGEKII